MILRVAIDMVGSGNMRQTPATLTFTTTGSCNCLQILIFLIRKLIIGIFASWTIYLQISKSTLMLTLGQGIYLLCSHGIWRVIGGSNKLKRRHSNYYLNNDDDFNEIGKTKLKNQFIRPDCTTYLFLCLIDFLSRGTDN